MRTGAILLALAALVALVYLRWPTAVYLRAVDSVVQIDTHTPSKDPAKERFGTGSGAFIDDMGTVLTVAHVVSKGRMVGVFVRGKKVPYMVRAIDERHDLAILKPMIPVWSAPLRLGLYVLPGEDVYAIGFPNTGNDGVMFSMGQVMGMRKGCLMTSMPIAPGSSGSPILSSNGAIVGVVTGYVMAHKNSLDWHGYTVGPYIIEVRDFIRLNK